MLFVPMLFVPMLFVPMLFVPVQVTEYIQPVLYIFDSRVQSDVYTRTSVGLTKDFRKAGIRSVN